MKRILSILLTALFLLTIVGLTINTHFCWMLHKSEITFFAKKSCCGEKKMPDNCCKNETKIVKITDKFFPSVLSFDFFKTFSDFLAPQFVFHSFDLKLFQQIIVSEHSPPLLRLPPIFILIHSFLIWFSCLIFKQEWQCHSCCCAFCLLTKTRK